MKKCPKCGTVYADDAIECVLDQTPFKRASTDTTYLYRPRLAVFTEHQIPASLVLVSYVFYLPAATCFGTIGGVCLWMFATKGFATGYAHLLPFIPYLVIMAGVGGFFFFLSRGLRRCERFWRNCALLVILGGFIFTGWNIAIFARTQMTPGHEYVGWFYLECAVSFILQIWLYRVLTRMSIRDLFFVEV